jgi:hypothetical protein
MALSTNFFYDGIDLQSSTKIFLDKLGLIPAPNGFYKEGGVVREYVDGAFVSNDFCDCPNPCDFIFTTTSETRSVYDATLPVGTDTGAIVFRLSVSEKNAGISATYDSVNYKNTYIPSEMLTTPRDFVLFGEATLPPCPNVAIDNSYTGVYRYVMSGGDFTVQATNLSFTAYANQVYNTGLQMGMLIIPKPDTSPSTADIRIYGLCPSFDFLLDANCVEQPTPIELYSEAYSTQEEVCAASLSSPSVFYYIKRDPSEMSFNSGDVFFIDQYCQTVMPQGYYIIGEDGAKNQYINIGSDGIIFGGIETCR